MSKETKVLSGIHHIIQDYIRKNGGKLPTTIFVPYGARYEFLSEVRPMLGYETDTKARPMFLGCEVVWTFRDDEVGVGTVEWLSE